MKLLISFTNSRPHCRCPNNPYANPLIDCSIRPPPTPQPPPTQPVQDEPECRVSRDCKVNKEVCRDGACVDPCPGLCGVNAQCSVYGHRPVCRCKDGHVGDPYSYCRREFFLLYWYASHSV